MQGKLSAGLKAKAALVERVQPVARSMCRRAPGFVSGAQGRQLAGVEFNNSSTWASSTTVKIIRRNNDGHALLVLRNRNNAKEKLQEQTMLSLFSRIVRGVSVTMKKSGRETS